MFKEQLQNLGLSKKEAIIYETLLQLGPSSIMPIVKTSKLKKGDVYNILNTLKKKNLIEEETNKTKKIFKSLQPQNLENLIEEKKQEINMREKILEQVVPQLSSLFQTTTEKPLIQILNGHEGIITFYEDILKAKKRELLIFVSKYHREEEKLTDIVDQQIKKQRKLGFTTRAINVYNPRVPLKHTIDYLKKRAINRSKIRFIFDKISYPSQIILYDNKVAITSMKKELITTLIENDNISQTMKMIFEQLWKKAKIDHDQILRTAK